MASALPSSPPPALHQHRAKALPLTAEHVESTTTEHVDDGTRVVARRLNRKLVVVPAMKASHVSPDEVAGAFAVNLRRVGRILEHGEKSEPQPFDLADLEILAAAGRREARLAREIAMRVLERINRIELSHT